MNTSFYGVAHRNACARFQYKDDSKITMELLDSDGENSEDNRCSGHVDNLMGEGSDDIQPEVVQQLKQKPVYLSRWVTYMIFRNVEVKTRVQHDIVFLFLFIFF